MTFIWFSKFLRSNMKPSTSWSRGCWHGRGREQPVLALCRTFQQSTKCLWQRGQSQILTRARGAPVALQGTTSGTSWGTTKQRCASHKRHKLGYYQTEVCIPRPGSQWDWDPSPAGSWDPILAAGCTALLPKVCTPNGVIRAGGERNAHQDWRRL